MAPNGSPLLHIEGMEAFNPAMVGGEDNGIRVGRDDIELDFPPHSDLNRLIFNGANSLVCPECLTPLRATDAFRTARGAKHKPGCDISIPDEKAPPSLRLERALKRRQPVIFQLAMPYLETGRASRKAKSAYDRLLKPPMIVRVQNATEWATFRARLLATPGRYYRSTAKITDHILFHHRLMETARQEVDTSNPIHVRRMLIDIMSRTSKPTSRDGRRTDIFYPYLFTVALGRNALPCLDARAAHTALLRVREGEYFKKFPLCRYGFPYAHVDFNVVCADPDIKAMLEGDEPKQIVATLNETKLRHTILSKQWRMAENGRLSIELRIDNPAQIVQSTATQLTIM